MLHLYVSYNKIQFPKRHTWYVLCWKLFTIYGKNWGIRILPPKYINRGVNVNLYLGRWIWLLVTQMATSDVENGWEGTVLSPFLNLLLWGFLISERFNVIFVSEYVVLWFITDKGEGHSRPLTTDYDAHLFILQGIATPVYNGGIYTSKWRPS